MRLAEGAAVFDPLDGMFLHQHPAVAALLQRFDEFVADIGMVWQRHLRWRETPDAAERLQPEDGGKMVLPGAHMQPIILNGRGRSYAVSPGGAQPLDRAPVDWVAGAHPETVDDVVETHRPQAMQQAARIFQHHARLLAFVDQLRNELAHALVAP